MKLHALFIAAALISSAALAETKTASSQVSLTVLPDCTISATDIDLGVYNFRTGASGAGTLRLKCNLPASIILATDNKTNAFERFLGLNNAIQVRRTLMGPSGSTIPYHVVFNMPTSVSTSQQVNSFEIHILPGAGVVGAGTGDRNDLNTTDLPVEVTVDAGLWKPAGQYTDLITYSLTYNP